MNTPFAIRKTTTVSTKKSSPTTPTQNYPYSGRENFLSYPNPKSPPPSPVHYPVTDDDVSSINFFDSYGRSSLYSTDNDDDSVHTVTIKRQFSTEELAARLENLIYKGKTGSPTMKRKSLEFELSNFKNAPAASYQQADKKEMDRIRELASGNSGNPPAVPERRRFGDVLVQQPPVKNSTPPPSTHFVPPRQYVSPMVSNVPTPSLTPPMPIGPVGPRENFSSLNTEPPRNPIPNYPQMPAQNMPVNMMKYNHPPSYVPPPPNHQPVPPRRSLDVVNPPFSNKLTSQNPPVIPPVRSRPEPHSNPMPTLMITKKLFDKGKLTAEPLPSVPEHVDTVEATPSFWPRLPTLDYKNPRKEDSKFGSSKQEDKILDHKAESPRSFQEFHEETADDETVRASGSELGRRDSRLSSGQRKSRSRSHSIKDADSVRSESRDKKDPKKRKTRKEKSKKRAKKTRMTKFVLIVTAINLVLLDAAVIVVVVLFIL